jgi:hypothetical protein
MTTKEYRIFNIVILKSNNSIINKSYKTIIDFDNLELVFADWNVLVYFEFDNIEEFYKKYLELDNEQQNSILNIKNYYIRTILYEFKWMSFYDIYKKKPKIFKDFWFWVKDELMPQYKIYNNDR